jgi:hypothetical protein
MNKTMKKTKSNSNYSQELSNPQGKRNSIIALHDKERDIYSNKMNMKPGAKVQLCYMRGGKKESTISSGNNN